MRVLAIGDIHTPCEKDGYRDFCSDMYEAWDCDTVVFVGDVVDMHNASVWEPEAEAPGPTDEADQSAAAIKKWVDLFPEATVCIGNHDDRVVKAAKRSRVPKTRFIRSYGEAWDTPGWDWTYEKTIDKVYYFHGDGYSGKYPAQNAAQQMAMSVVMGHIHTSAGYKWIANPHKKWFGMDVGCGIDDKKYAFYYARAMKKRPILACGIIIDGKPYHEVMD